MVGGRTKERQVGFRDTRAFSVLKISDDMCLGKYLQLYEENALSGMMLDNRANVATWLKGVCICDRRERGRNVSALRNDYSVVRNSFL